MRITSLLFLLVISTIFSLSAQKRPEKFLTKADSVNHQLFRELLYGTKEAYADSIFTFKTDSGEISLDREALHKKYVAIKVYRYNFHQPQSSAISLQEALKSNEKDTIQKISITGREYKKLPFSIRKFKALSELEIINTRIRKLPWFMNWSIFGLKNLKELSIHNQQNSQAFVFKKNNHIIELDYSDNPFSPQARNIYKLSKVEVLKLVKNDFKNCSAFELHKMKKLKEVNLRGNSVKIEQLADQEVPALTKLVLTDNGILEVPETIKFFPQLTELQLAENKITSEKISSELSTLKKLELLSFYKNDLTFIPDFVFTLGELTDLDLYYNEIEKLPDSIAQLKKLKHLYLANNRIYRIPEEIGQMEQLTELYLKHNRISYLPESLCKLKNITDFHIGHNYLQSFPSCVLSFHQLEDLDISFNEIHSIPKELLDLKDLKILWLKGLVFQATSKEEALEIKNTIESLQEKGVNVGITYE